MKYFKNTELAKLYNVSEKSVRNWVQAASEGKLELQLFEDRGKLYISNTAKNNANIESLVEKGKKYKNSRGHKVITPGEKFYKLYSPRQIVDIISNLDIYRETPLQYTYFNSGAKKWDKYTHHLLTEKSPNSLVSTINLLELNMSYLDMQVAGYEGVNIVDLGVGNALPIRNMLEHFIEHGKLRRYVAIDISKELLHIAQANLCEWFGGDFPFEGHVKDITTDRFDDLLVEESFGDKAGSTANIVLFLGGTISNLREPSRAYATIVDSMGKNDLLLFSKKLDTEKSRRYFEMAVRGNQAIDLVLKLMNVDESLYALDQLFDAARMAREVHAVLKVAISIKFELKGQTRFVELNKGDRILLWRARHQTAVETIQEFDANGFEIMQASRSNDQDYLLLTTKIKSSKRAS